MTDQPSPTALVRAARSAMSRRRRGLTATDALILFCLVGAATLFAISLSLRPGG